MNIQELAQYAVQNRKNLTKVNENFKCLEAIFNCLTEEQKEQQQINLAKLYLAMFKPEKEKRGKLTTMQSLAKFAAKNDVRYYLNYVYINAEGYGIASTGHILLVTKNKTDLEPGFYDPKTLIKVEELDFAKFPNFDKVFQNTNFAKELNIVEPSDIKIEKPSKGKPYECYKIGNFYYQADYLKLAKLVVGIETGYCGDGGELLLENDNFKCIVMPIKL